jgi:hypothetical protein
MSSRSGATQDNRLQEMLTEDVDRERIRERLSVLNDAWLTCPVYGSWRYDVIHLGVRYFDCEIYAEGLPEAGQQQPHGEEHHPNSG